MRVEERKALLRKAIRGMAPGTGPSDAFREASDRAQKHFLDAYPPRAGTIVALYRAVSGEVGTDGIRDAYLSAGARVYYPAVTGKGILSFFRHREGDEWSDGAYGIPEPRRRPGQRPRRTGFDLVVVPGVAFDRGGNRLGRGCGYYDRFLGSLPSAALRVGMAFSHRVVGEVPADHWDMRMDALVTEEGVIRFVALSGPPKK